MLHKKKVGRFWLLEVKYIFEINPIVSVMNDS